MLQMAADLESIFLKWVYSRSACECMNGLDVHSRREHSLGDTILPSTGFSTTVDYSL